MLLTEEMLAANPVKSPSERQKCIIAKEKSLLALAWDRTRFSHDVARTASRLLAVIAYSDHRDPIDLTLLSDESGSSGDAGSDRGSKRPADPEAPVQKPPAKKPRRPNTAATIPPKTQVACLTRNSGDQEWILGRISRYIPESKKYEVLDEVDEDETYKVPRKNIRVIPKKAQSFEPKKRVLAVYPYTTVFYPAVLVTRSGKNWLVEFDDEEAEEQNQLKEVDGRLVMLQ